MLMWKMFFVMQKYRRVTFNVVIWTPAFQMKKIAVHTIRISNPLHFGIQKIKTKRKEEGKILLQGGKIVCVSCVFFVYFVYQRNITGQSRLCFGTSHNVGVYFVIYIGNVQAATFIHFSSLTRVSSWSNKCSMPNRHLKQ